VGALFIVGLLADRLFLIKADAFAGSRFPNSSRSLSWPWSTFWICARATAARGRTRSTTPGGKSCGSPRSPILLWQVAAALATLFVLALVVLRSGNDGGVGVSAGELKVRALLDQLLYTRPRFKEF
jgi:hypothetical protein